MRKQKKSKPRKQKKCWYAVKCVFRHNTLGQRLGLPEEDGETLYEERVVIFRAGNFNEAIALGEVEADEYATSDGTIQYTGFISAYHMFERKLKSGAEIYSLMRQSKRDTEAFLDHYYDDGTERTQHFED